LGVGLIVLYQENLYLTIHAEGPHGAPSRTPGLRLRVTRLLMA
jgi:hypothetical protein